MISWLDIIVCKSIDLTGNNPWGITEACINSFENYPVENNLTQTLRCIGVGILYPFLVIPLNAAYDNPEQKIKYKRQCIET